jgi:hypothetical protein
LRELPGCVAGVFDNPRRSTNQIFDAASLKDRIEDLVGGEKINHY